ncbi:MAG: hypothetical protein Q7U86_05270 [Draconibacterium sp.]|nr:hypothetical protein [Draconibacterium sp.]
MKRNWLIILFIISVLAALYFIEMSKVKSGGENSMPTLDNLQTDEISGNWEPFYKVRATIIDGQSASFSIPDELRDKEGKELKLSGAVVFFGNGCEIIDSITTRVNTFFILPSLGLAQACVLQPDVAMRWTIRVNLANPWILSRNEMIDAEATVSGIFKIDTSKPYEAAFIIENASAELKP